MASLTFSAESRQISLSLSPMQVSTSTDYQLAQLGHMVHGGIISHVHGHVSNSRFNHVKYCLLQHLVLLHTSNLNILSWYQTILSVNCILAQSWL